ncbi:MAG: peptide deformylase [Chitinispirillia bacterium]|nr:peptide deformylase [Chitinispirillia bacterium]MCL2268355.1 peptide deformylase [Chitinispirillia bacterium]
MLELCYYGDTVLRKAAAPVENFDEGLAELINEMIDTLRAEDGVGLAAPQVGKSLRLVVVDVSSGEGESEPHVLVNPEITCASEEKIVEEEGCLSLPGITLMVSRSAKVSVKAKNGKGEEVTIENAEGLLAKALQHELDHINGILFIDHVSSVQRAMLSGKLKKIAGKK